MLYVDVNLPANLTSRNKRMTPIHPHLLNRSPYTDILLIIEQIHAFDSGLPMTISVEAARDVARSVLARDPDDDVTAGFLARLDGAFPGDAQASPKPSHTLRSLREALIARISADRFADERMAEFYMVMPPATALLAFTYAVLAAIIAPYVPHRTLIFWLLPMFAVLGLRTFMGVRWRWGRRSSYIVEAAMAHLVMIASNIGNAAVLYVMGPHAPAAVVPVVYASTFLTFYSSILIIRMFPALVAVNFVIGAAVLNAASYRIDPSLIIGGGLFTVWTIINAFVQVRNLDVSLQRKAALLEERATLSHVLSTLSATSATWPIALDSRLRLTECPPLLARALSASAADLANKALLSILAPTGVPPSGNLAFEALRSHLATRKSIRKMAIRVKSGRTEREWTLWATPQIDEAGVFEGYKGILSDTTVTNRKADPAHVSSDRIPLFNAVEFELETAVDRASQDRECAAGLYIIDWRNYDEVVRAQGVEALDKVRSLIADRIRELHPDAIVASLLRMRLLCLVPGIAGTAGAVDAADALLADLPSQFGHFDICPAFAIGGAHTDSASGSLQTLIDQAEAALADAIVGGGAMRVHTPKPRVLAPIDALVVRIAQALELKAVSLRFSAIHDPTNHNIVALMASVLWADDMIASIPRETAAELMTTTQFDALLAKLQADALTVLDRTAADLPVYYPAWFGLRSEGKFVRRLRRFVNSERIGIITEAGGPTGDIKLLRKLAMACHPVLVPHQLASVEPTLAAIAAGILDLAFTAEGLTPADEVLGGKGIALGVGTLAAARDVADAGYSRFCGLKATSNLSSSKIVKAIDAFNRGSSVTGAA